jgi:hypothetical protein
MDGAMPSVSSRAGRATRDALVAHLRDLADSAADATLTLERGPFVAHIHVHGGRVTGADADALRGERALGCALDASHGTWRVARGVGRMGAPFAPVDELIASLDARRAHIRALAESVGGLDRVWAVLFRVLRRELPHIPDDVNPLLRLVDGKRTIARILRESPFDEILTLRILHRLLAKGILIVPELPPGASSDDDEFAASAMSTLLAVTLPPTSTSEEAVADVDAPAPPIAAAAPSVAPVLERDVSTPVVVSAPESLSARAEPRPLPRLDDDDKAAIDEVTASAVSVRAWSSKRERPPGITPDDDEEETQSGPAPNLAPRAETPPVTPPALFDTASAAEHSAEHSPSASTTVAEGALADAGEPPIVVETALPSAELTDWLDEEHAFFTRDDAPHATPAEAHVAEPRVSERAVLFGVLFVVSVLLAFAVVRLWTQASKSDDAKDVPVNATVESAANDVLRVDAPRELLAPDPQAVDAMPDGE